MHLEPYCDYFQRFLFFTIRTFENDQAYPKGIKTIVCKYYDRNKSKNPETVSKEAQQKPGIKDIDCPVSYKFFVSANGKAILLKTIKFTIIFLFILFEYHTKHSTDPRT